MTTINPPGFYQARTRLLRCVHCSEPIRTGTRRPRIFCDRPGCRQAASRARRKEQAFQRRLEKAWRLTRPGEFCDAELRLEGLSRPPENNARTASGAKLGVRKPLKSLKPCHSNFDTPVNLIGGERTGGSLDPRLAGKIFAAELGVPTKTVVSPDGIVATVTSKRGEQR